MIQTLIFDFDGTIADTFDLANSIFTRLAEEFQYQIPTKDQMKLLKTQHPREIIKTLGIPYIKLPFIAYRIKSEIHKEILQLKPIPGMVEALLHLKRKKYHLGIITSNDRKNVITFLKNNGIDIFDFINTGNNIFGKANVISRVLRDKNILRNTTIYVGDEIRDIEAAHKVGIQMIGVTWGFNDKKGLEKYQPDFLINKPKDLLAILEKYQ